MYFPYFRGKQYELLTIKENAKLISKNKIIPIIEPVKKNISGLKRTLQTLKDYEAQFVLIVNPKFGELNGNTTFLQDEILEDLLKEYEKWFLGYILDGKTTIQDIKQFLRDNDKRTIAFIHNDFKDGKQLIKLLATKNYELHHIFCEDHSGKLYQKKFKNQKSKRILIRDGFNRQRNVDYPDDEHFSDLNATYEDEGMDGFGDYLIVGNQYSETGGPAYAVAIHLTYLDEDDDMRIKHFISDRTDTPIDPAGKFIEALEKLIAEINDPSSEVFNSNACNEFRELYKKRHFPGLGYVKKLSMKHHIELIANYLNG